MARNKKIKAGLPLLAIITLVLVSWVLVWFYAPPIGAFAGKAVGSWYGVTEGIQKGAEDGKEEGLSANDTVIDISNKIMDAGNLQILLVDFYLTDLYEQGPEGDPYYAALWGMEAEITFTIDLTQSETVYDQTQNQILIIIPEPIATHYFDDSSIKVLAEYEPPFFNGSTEDGYKGYLNSRSQIEQKIQEKIRECDSLLEQAKNSALKQVEQLAKALCGNKYVIKVQFNEGGNELNEK